MRTRSRRDKANESPQPRCFFERRKGDKSNYCLTRDVFLEYSRWHAKNSTPSAGGNDFSRTQPWKCRDRIFDDDADYAAFEKILAETQAEVFVRILSYCLMPNHWHLVLWPLKDGDLGRFMQRLSGSMPARSLDFLRLHSAYASARFSNSSPPPCLIGMMCSIWSRIKGDASCWLWQYSHRLYARTRTNSRTRASMR